MSISGDFLRSDFNQLGPLIELDAQAFPFPWSAQQWEELNPDHHLLFCWQDRNRANGLALFGRIGRDSVAHLLKICLEPAFQGKGGSTEFWIFVVKQLVDLEVKSIFLEVEELNHRAIGFYRKVGFRTLRLSKNFYSNGSNALIMELTL
jgi:[ribosomal protein S18]-alanine N-acetyltransferase